MEFVEIFLNINISKTNYIPCMSYSYKQLVDLWSANFQVMVKIPLFLMSVGCWLCFSGHLFQTF